MPLDYQKLYQRTVRCTKLSLHCKRLFPHQKLYLRSKILVSTSFLVFHILQDSTCIPSLCFERAPRLKDLHHFENMLDHTKQPENSYYLLEL